MRIFWRTLLIVLGLMAALGSLALVRNAAAHPAAPAAPAVPLDFIELNRTPSPPSCVQPGGTESFNWTITFSSIPDHYVYSITNPLNNVVYGPFTVNIQGRPSPVTGSDSWPVPANALPGNYGISIYYYSNFGLEATARVIFIVCTPATTTPTPTATPTATNTATNTPVPPTNTATNTATDTPTPMATPTATDTPTDTPVVPTNTPTNTPVPPTNTPTNTPTLPPCNVCNLSVTQVTISCNSDGTVHWTATIRNRGACIVADNYTIALQSKVPGGQFQTVRTQPGWRYFPPGNTVLSGTFCYAASPRTNAIRVAVDLDSQQARCTIAAKSPSIAPCRPASCPGGPAADGP